MFVFFNPNSCGKSTGDCVIRALTIATGMDWHDVYVELCAVGYAMCDWGNSNSVWESWLVSNGYHRNPTGELCTVERFATLHPSGVYICATGSHVVAVVDGNWIDSWDSGREIVQYYFWR